MSFKNIPRLYINKELKQSRKISIEKKDTHYLKNVLRLSAGDKIRVFNGVHGEWKALILSNSCNQLLCKKLIKKQQFINGPSLYFSLIKSNNLRWLLEKATELGVKELYPIITERVNIRNFNYRKAMLHLKEASEVSERLDLPKLHQCKTLNQVLEELKKTTKKVIFCNESRKDIHLSNYFNKQFLEEVSFIVGPEGGFSEKEVKELLIHPNVKSVKIHDRIIKAETAVILVLSIYKNFLVLNT